MPVHDDVGKSKPGTVLKSIINKTRLADEIKTKDKMR